METVSEGEVSDKSVDDIDEESFVEANDTFIVDMTDLDLPSIKNLIANRKGYMTQYEKRFDHFAGFIKQDPEAETAAYIAEEVQKIGEKYRLRYEQLVDYLQQASDLDPGHAPDYVKDIETMTGRYEKTMFEVLIPLERRVLKKPGPAAPVPQQEPPSVNQVEMNKFVLQDLKPFQLEEKHSAIVFQDWLDRFGVYFRASGITHRPPDQQRAFVRNFISPGLWTLLEAEISNLPVYSEDEDNVAVTNSVMKVIVKQFFKLQPLLMRRFALFSKMQTFQSASEFAAEVQRDGRAAAIHLLTEQELTALLILKGLSNEALIREILKLPSENLTLTRIKDTIRVFENSSESAKILVTANQASHSTDTLNEVCQVKSGYRCNTCGSTEHLRQDCKFRNSICFNCEKVGHLAKICHSPKVENSEDSTTDTDTSSDEDSTTDNEENVPNQVNSIYTDACNYSIAY